jgi:serine/threonine protein phosphatase PrpC
MAEGTAGPSVTAAIVGMTDVGRVREHNEDSFLVLDRDGGRRPKPGERIDVQLRTASLLMVCDGMGGAAAGEVASRMAADRVAQVLGEADLGSVTPDQVASLMDRAVQQANAEIFEKAKANPDLKGMGTTLTAAIATPGRLFVSQVGDSRAYLLRKGLLNQITKDQSLIGQLIEEGTLTEEEAEKLGGRNIVLQAVGVEEALRVDTKNWPMLRGDVLVLCSDGLSGMVKDARIREILTECGDDLSKAAEKLIAEANANGGRDNVTVIVAKFDGEALRPPMEGGDVTMEAAGAAFKAPPPPEVPNPMKKVAGLGALLLAAIGGYFWLTRPTTADVEMKVAPDGATVVVRGAAMPEPRTFTSAGGFVRMDGLPIGTFEASVNAPRHIPKSSSFAVESPGIQTIRTEVALVPNPVTLVLRSKAPNVTVRVRVTPSHPENSAVDRTERIPEAGQERRMVNVPAGAIELVATRPGYRQHRVAEALLPGEKELEERTYDVPLTEMIKGRLRVAASEGFRVRVLDEDGAELAAGPAGQHGFASEVRVGRLTVVASAPGYREFRAQVEVKEGEETTVSAQAEAEEVRVTVVGRAAPEVVVDRLVDGKWKRDWDSRQFTQGFTAPPFRLAPGTWQVRYGDRSEGLKFDVNAGQDAFEVDLERR